MVYEGDIDGGSGAVGGRGEGIGVGFGPELVDLVEGYLALVGAEVLEVPAAIAYQFGKAMVHHELLDGDGAVGVEDLDAPGGLVGLEDLLGGFEAIDHTRAQEEGRLSAVGGS